MNIFMADSIDYGLGSVMLQVYEDKTVQPIYFTSRNYSTAEMKYTVTERECLEIFHALTKWRFYLHGGPAFFVMTYHEFLHWLISLKEQRGRFARWMV